MRSIFLMGAVIVMASSCSQKDNAIEIANAKKAAVDSVNKVHTIAAQQRTIDSLKNLAVMPMTAAVAAGTVAVPAGRTMASAQPATVYSYAPANRTVRSSRPSVRVTPASETTAKRKLSPVAKGAIIGAGVGAVTGAVVSKKRVKGAVVGGVVGAAAGAGVGILVDKNNRKKAQEKIEQIVYDM